MNTTLLLLMLSPLPAVADPDEPVTAGREALDHWWGSYPWYDSETDGVRRVEIPEPRDWSWLWAWLPDWNWSGAGGWRSALPNSILEWLAWIVLILLLAGVAYLLVRAYREREPRSADASGDDESSEKDEEKDRVESLPFPVRRGRLDLLDEARRHYRQGDYGQAVVYLFSFQLVQLDKRQIIRLTRGKTNRQYLREVGRRGALRRLVEQTMVAFEDVFFGNHTIDRARFESCWSRLDEFESLAAEGAG